MSISRSRPSRFVFTKTFDLADMQALPTNLASVVTYAIGGDTLPDRGLIHRASVLAVATSPYSPLINDLGCWLLHTNGTNLATQLTPTETLSIIGQAPYNPLTASLTGADVPVSGNIFVFQTELSFSTANLTAVGAATVGSPSREAYINGGQSKPIYYDVSENVLGPATNTGSLYMTLCSDGSADYKALLAGLQIRLEIEPCF